MKGQVRAPYMVKGINISISGIIWQSDPLLEFLSIRTCFAYPEGAISLRPAYRSYLVRRGLENLTIFTFAFFFFFFHFPGLWEQQWAEDKGDRLPGGSDAWSRVADAGEESSSQHHQVPQGHFLSLGLNSVCGWIFYREINIFYCASCDISCTIIIFFCLLSFGRTLTQEDHGDNQITLEDVTQLVGVVICWSVDECRNSLTSRRRRCFVSCTAGVM